MSDQTPEATSPEESLSPEVADYVGMEDESQAPAAADEKVIPAETGETPPETQPEGEPTPPAEVPPAPEPVKEPEPKVEPPKEDSQPKEFVVAGQKYTSLDAAIAAVNRISGDNSRLAGDLKLTAEQLTEKEKAIEDLKKTNEAWEKYYNGDGEKPGADIEKIVEQVLERKQKAQSEADRVKQYKDELMALPKEEDYAEVFPKMEELAERLGENLPKISPKELYKMARGLVKEQVAAPEPKSSDTLPPPAPIVEAVKEGVNKEIAKSEAKKMVGGASRRSSSIVELPVSREVADYVEDIN